VLRFLAPVRGLRSRWRSVPAPRGGAKAAEVALRLRPPWPLRRFPAPHLSKMALKLHRFALFAARRRWILIGAWLVAVAVLLTAFRAFGDDTSDNLELPGTDSQAATDLLAERFPPQQNGSNPIVFYTEDGKVTDPANQRAIKASRAAIEQVRHVVTAPSPFGKRRASQISDNKRTAFIPVLLDVSNDELTEHIASSVLDAAEPARRAGMRVAAGGSIGSELSQPETESSEVVGLTAAMIILAFTFGSLVAMGLPILSAVFGLLAGLGLIGLLTQVVQVPSIGPTLATMIGLGVGIDYALFLVTRYRSERAAGRPLDEAIATAVATTGTAIVFAGSTVVIALVTLVIAGIPLVTTLGYTAAFAVVTAVLAAITLLPAVLSLIGTRIDSLRLPRLLRPTPKPEGTGRWAAWARFVTGHPWRSVGIATLILVPLIVPMFALDLGQEDVGATPKSTTERQAYDLMASGFGVGYNGPLQVAVELGTSAKPSKQFKQQKQQATSLQANLEAEQAEGEAEQASLSAQAEEVEAEQAALEAEAAALEAQAGELGARRAGIEATRDQLARESSLRAELARLVAKAKPIARKGAELAAEERAIEKALDALAGRQARVEARLDDARTPEEHERLSRRLAELERGERDLERELARVEGARRKNERRARQVSRQAARIRKQAAALGDEAVALSGAAATAAAEAASVERSMGGLREAAADAASEASSLEAQKSDLQSLQQKAKQQQKKAEQLSDELTKELTKAGGDERGTDPRLVSLQNALTKTTGVETVSPPQINGSGKAAIFTAIPTTAPAAVATADLVETFREYVIPESTADTDVEAHVGGQTASYVDLAAEISASLVLVIAAVVALGFLVLMTAFRSALIAGQAAVANVLSVSAAFGVVTLCFQEGWGLSLVGLETASGTDPIASFVPLIMFAVLFGLSMDYQVFLMSQIERHRATGEGDRAAIAGGLETGAPVISAAALIMISVFGSFILNGDPTVKQFGVGLSVGVALAAITVLLLAPALLVLAGRGSWWVPRWADRVLPHLDVEGSRAAQATSADDAAPAGR
jgi:uncharacterized membrane protein YdfJ with MMPL/SSD domain